MPTRLSPITDSASDVILVGDPRRAFLLAQELTVAPKMSHLARGLWGYTGGAPSGRPVTIQSTGIGGPSAAVTIKDIAGEGVGRVVRLGTCFGLRGGLTPGSVIQVTSVLGVDGLSRQLDVGGALAPDGTLNSLLDGLGSPGRVSSHDLSARNDPDYGEACGPGPDEAVVARDLQTATTFAVARELSIASAALLIVVESKDEERLGVDQLEMAFIDLGRRVLERISPAKGTPDQA